MDYPDTEFFRAPAYNLIAALERYRRQENPIGKIFQVVCVSANADLALYSIVIRRKVRIIDGPVFSSAINRPALEVTMAETPGYGVPCHRLPSDSACSFRIKAGHAGSHCRNMPARKVERHRMCIESRPRIDFRSALEHHDVDTHLRQVSGKRPASCTGADYTHVVDLPTHLVQFISPESLVFLAKQCAAQC